MVSLLLNRKADINAQTIDGWTPLMEAIYSNHPETAAQLIDRGADIKLKSDDGMTALMMASVRGHASNRRNIDKKEGGRKWQRLSREIGAFVRYPQWKLKNSGASEEGGCKGLGSMTIEYVSKCPGNKCTRN